jgi:hypothetical protein
LILKGQEMIIKERRYVLVNRQQVENSLNRKKPMKPEPKLSELRVKIAEMCDERFAPKPLCWIENLRDGEQSEGYYCPECAKKMIDYLSHGKYRKEVLADKHADHPRWKGLKDDDLSYTNSCGSFETEGCEHCELCDCMLQVCLLEYGVQSEIEHFETVDANHFDGQDSYHWLDVIDGIDFSSEEGIYNEWWTPKRIEDNKQLYGQVLKLTKKFLKMEN